MSSFLIGVSSFELITTGDDVCSLQRCSGNQNGLLCGWVVRVRGRVVLIRYALRKLTTSMVCQVAVKLAKL